MIAVAGHRPPVIHVLAEGPGFRAHRRRPGDAHFPRSARRALDADVRQQRLELRYQLRQPISDRHPDFSPWRSALSAPTSEHRLRRQRPQELAQGHGRDRHGDVDLLHVRLTARGGGHHPTRETGFGRSSPTRTASSTTSWAASLALHRRAISFGGAAGHLIGLDALGRPETMGPNDRPLRLRLFSAAPSLFLTSAPFFTLTTITRSMMGSTSAWPACLPMSVAQDPESCSCRHARPIRLQRWDLATRYLPSPRPTRACRRSSPVMWNHGSGPGRLSPGALVHLTASRSAAAPASRTRPRPAVAMKPLPAPRPRRQLAWARLEAHSL